MSQLLAGAGPYAIVKTWGIEGTATDVGDVTIGIVDGNGDSVVSPGTATTNNADGTYTYSLATQASPNQLTLTWTRTDTSAALPSREEVVGIWLFNESQARTFHAKADAASALIPLASATEYPDATLAENRESIQEELEQWTGRSFVTRYARLEIPGNGTRFLPVANGFVKTATGTSTEPFHRPGHARDIGIILSATVGESAVTLANIKVDPVSGVLIRTDSVWQTFTTADPQNVVVEYVYGLPYLIDGVDRIAMKLLVDRLVPSSFPDRAISVDTDFGTTRFVQPGGPMNNVSRLPEVNAWVRSHNVRVPVF